MNNLLLSNWWGEKLLECHAEILILLLALKIKYYLIGGAQFHLF